MEKITTAVLKKAAKNLLLDMSEDEYALLEREFDILLRQMDLIGNIQGIDEATPITFPFDIATDAMRADIATEPASAKEILGNAGNVFADQIKVPKVVG